MPNSHGVFGGAACAGLVCSVLCGAEAFAQPARLDGSRTERAGQEPVASPLIPVREHGDGVVSLVFDGGAYRHISAHESVRMSAVPLAPGVRVDLDLSRFEVLAPGAKVVAVTDAGEVALARPDVQLWRGNVSGEPGSHAFLALSPSGSAGYVKREGKTYIISSGGGGAQETVVFGTASDAGRAITIAPPTCDGALLPPGEVPVAQVEPPGTEALYGPWPCRSFQLAVDCDNEFTNNRFGGNVTSAAAYATLLAGAVSEIYQRDMNVTLQLSYLRCWSTTDPYTQSDMSAQLTQFQSYWNANMGSVPRTVAHLLSGRSLGGGIAWLRAACSQSYGYGVSANINGSFPYPVQDHHSQNWDLIVMAHELGHNLGSGHTHDANYYNPPVDGCGASPRDCSQAWNGTIMSYCHTCPGGIANISMTFGPRPSTAIRAYLDGSAASCGTNSSVSFTQHPADARLGAPTVTFSAAATAGGGSGTPAYRWRRNGANVSNGATPWGSVVSGATTGTLTISGAKSSDAGTYDVVATNGCASATSAGAKLLCGADYDRNGFVNGDDFDAFVTVFEAGAANADHDGNGFVNGDDFDAYVAAFAAGC